MIGRSSRAFTMTAFVFLFASFSGCKNSRGKQEASVQGSTQLVFEKILGTWQNQQDSSFERWTRKPDGSYQSVVFAIKGKDTSWNEQASIYEANGHWVFENAVKDQNSGQAVKFISSIVDDSAVQFSNPQHDFPTDINYTVIDDHTLHAFIIGPNNKGGRDTIPFDYQRIK